MTLYLSSEYDDDGKVISTEIQVWKIPEVPSCSTPEPVTEVQSTVTSDKLDADKNINKNDAANDEGSSTSAGPQKYIPPAQRAAMKAAAAAAASGSGGRGSDVSVPRTLGGPRRNQRIAPDISNEELFPSLGGKPGANKSSVWGGGLGSNASSRGQSPLTSGGGGAGKLITDVSLENKWDALNRGAE